MTVQDQIESYLGSLTETKCRDMRELHRVILQLMPSAQLWFLDGKDDKGKVVSNPNIGYGQHTIQYADGKSKQFYKIGISANTSGISVYIMGIDDKELLAKTYGEKIGKASLSGYCIKFKALKDIHVEVLKDAIKTAIAA